MRFRRRSGDPADTLPPIQIRVTAREGPPASVLPEPLFWRTDLADSEWLPPVPRVVLEGVIFQRVRLERPRLGLFAVCGSTFRDCTFTGLVADEGTLGAWRLGRSYYTDCRFEECDLSWMEPGWTRFSGCVFADCRIKEWFARDASFIGCSFPGTSLLETTFFGKGTGLGRRDMPNEIRENDFTGADLLWTSFVGGVDLRAQTWPDDGDVVILTDIQERVAWARQQIGTWKGRERRKQAVHRLDRLTLREGPEQRDLFHHRGIIGQPQVDELHEELFALLERAPV